MPLIINGETFPDDLIDQEYERIKAHYENMGSMSCCGRDEEFRELARSNGVARILIHQEAARRFPEIPESEVDAAINSMIEAEGGRAAFFAHAGLTEEDAPAVRREIASGLQVDRLMLEIWGDSAPPDEAAARAFYEAHLGDYLSVEEVQALHIFKNVAKVEDRENCYQLMRRLRQEARAGADFEALALANTDKEDRQVDLGFFRRGEFMEEFDLIVFSLEEGEVSPVFGSHWGFHLVKITGRRPPQPHPFEQVREDVEGRMENEHRSLATRALVDRLRAAAVITGE